MIRKLGVGLFAKKTALGWSILKLGVDESGNLFALCDTIGQSGERFVVGRNYDLHSGRWVGGDYFHDFEDAVRRYEYLVEYDVNPDFIEKHGYPGFLFWTRDGGKVLDLGVNRKRITYAFVEVFEKERITYRIVEDYDVYTGTYGATYYFDDYSVGDNAFTYEMVRRFSPMEFMGSDIGRSGKRR